MTLSANDLDDLTSLGDGEAIVRQRTGLSALELKEAALDANIEKCPHCHWWCEAGELLPDDSDRPDGRCSNCR